MPEKLHLLYPKTLSGRLESSNELRADVEVNAPRSLPMIGPRLIDIDEVRELSKLTLRLEALCSQTATSGPVSPISPLTATTSMEMTPSKRIAKGVRIPPPSHLGPAIREEMSDSDLAEIVESLTTRIENCTSTLVSISFLFTFMLSSIGLDDVLTIVVSEIFGWVWVGYGGA